MGNNQIKEVYRVATRKDRAETGGGHNQKGIDVQRAGAIERMFDLEKSGASDFLFLFESIQDIAELDSPTAPSSMFSITHRSRQTTNLKSASLCKRSTRRPTT